METGQSKNGHGQDADQDDQAQRDDGWYLRQAVLVLDQIIGREAEDGRHVDRQRNEEQEEVAVIPSTDAVIHPRTMMIERLTKHNKSINKRFRLVNHNLNIDWCLK